MTLIRLIIATSLLLFALSGAHAAKRVALVIGNSAYQHIAHLKNPKSDASDMAKALRKVGFEVVLRQDLNRRELINEIRDFSLKSKAAEIALVFYTGHGIPQGDQDFVIPIDADPKNAVDIPDISVGLREFVEAASQATQRGAVIIDTVRINPFGEHARPVTNFKVWQSNKGGSLFVAYSTEMGMVALDGYGRNSPYVEALLKQFSAGAPSLVRMLEFARNYVSDRTNGEQNPIYYRTDKADDFPLSMPDEKTVPSPRNENRIALVIGNNDYQQPWPDLDNPVNDAKAIAVKLSDLGFKVTRAVDATRSQMEGAIQKFARASSDADTALVFYAGHGVQHNGINYLVPVDGKLADETDLRRYILVSDILADLQKAKGAKILILDACRNSDTVFEYLESLPKTRSLPKNRGLAEEKAEGVLIAFAAQPDAVAADALPGTPNSPFTTALLNHIATPGVELRTMLTRVRAEVYRSTKQSQLPETSDSMIGEFRFAQE
ncbi:MAG: caspase family protein [Rhizobiaceae bacterium]